MVVLVFCFDCVGQKKQVNLPRLQNCRLEESFESKESRRFGIPFLLKDTIHTNYYRLSNSQQIIDVWQKDSIFGGFVLSFIYKCTEPEENCLPTMEYVFSKEILAKELAEEILCLLQKMDSIPCGSRVNFRSETLSLGDMFTIQKSTKTHFIVKNFIPYCNCCNTFPSIPDIDMLVSFIFIESKLGNRYDYLIGNLQPGEYQDSDYRIIVRKNGKHKLKSLKG